MKREIAILQECHDKLVNQTIAINRLISSFDTNLSKDERMVIRKQLTGLEKSISNLKNTINKIEEGKV